MEETLSELRGHEVDVSRMILILAKTGMTNEEVATAIGLTPGKFKHMLDKNPDFREIFNEAKEDSNYRVEQSLFKRALGYQTKEVVQREGRPVQVTIKEYAPDPVSCIFWLKNRSPKRWRDVVEHRHSLKDRMERAHEAVAERSRGMLTAGDGMEG